MNEMDPEKLNDRLNDLDEYMKEMNCINERVLEEEDVDDYLKEVDNAIAADADVVNSLPDVPTTMPKNAAAEEVKEKAQLVEE